MVRVDADHLLEYAVQHMPAEFLAKLSEYVENEKIAQSPELLDDMEAQPYEADADSEEDAASEKNPETESESEPVEESQASESSTSEEEEKENDGF